MAGKGRITVLILVITAFAVAGCSISVGNIGEGISTSKTFNGLLVKYKSAYKKGEFFRWGDVTVTPVTRDGDMGLSVPPTDIRIKDPADTGQLESVDKVYGYELTKAGDKIVMVRYENLSTQYYIEVWEDSDIENNQSSGINIVWAE
jgi:hypothetical protein